MPSWLIIHQKGNERWNENYYTMRDGVMAAIPYPLRVVIGYLAWRKTNAGLCSQGTGRFSAGEIHSFRDKIWHSLDGLLAESRHKNPSGQRPFWALGGKEPTEADTSLFGFVIAGLVCDAYVFPSILSRNSGCVFYV